MSKFKLNPELFIGESSELDAVFLPVGDGHHSEGEPAASWGGLDTNLNQRDPHQVHPKARDLEAGVEDRKDMTGNKDNGDTPDSNDLCYRTSLTSIAVIILIVTFLVFGHRHIRSGLMWLEQVEPTTSVSIIAALFVVISFPIAWGLSLLMVTSGYLYGLLYGPLVVTFSVTIGLSISTPVMRLLCSDYLRSRFYSRKVEAILNVVSGSHGMKVIALTRLTPIPFGLQNALFSLSSISLLRYLVSSVGGLVPMTVLNCYLGSTLRTMQDLMSDDSNRFTGFFIFGGQLLITVVLLWFVIRKARGELKKAMDDSERTNYSLPNGDCSKTVFLNPD
ncbi:transmembrane protein 64-like isoform X2 [Physella acuta]|uniref:transmembrane protein 64-like isoform X2 n=1 Tax=Physella acuta TaxID=109671 RepID=UPI0027DCECB8|nr:transmembrane protein 64-like isoform X2 [Physella acuta]